MGARHDGCAEAMQRSRIDTSAPSHLTPSAHRRMHTCPGGSGGRGRPHARGARQGHLLHEGEVTPGVARQVHAALGAVRPRRRCIRVACRCRAAVGARWPPGRATGRRVARAELLGGRTRAYAQGRVRHRARGAAGGGRVAQPEVAVSAPPPRRAPSAAAVGEATADARER